MRLAADGEIQDALREAAAAVENQKFTPFFLWTEWANVVDAWQLDTWELYRDVKRLGRKTRLPENQRRTLWSIFEGVKTELEAQNLITESQMFTRLATKLATLSRAVFDCAVIDEAQDVSIAELRFFAALGGKRPNALFFAGDLGQRIFQQPFSWRSLGIDVRGRSSRLRINYRTSHQIRQHADRLLAAKVADVDGLTEERTGISVFNSVPPTIVLEKNEAAEQKAIAAWVKSRLDEELRPHEIAIFVRSSAQLPRAEAAAKTAGVPYVTLDENVETRHDRLSIATMHLAKGLEFRAVAVMACDDETLPL